MYAVGGNRRAATLTGIRVPRVVIGSFCVSALLCGMGVVVISSRLGSAQSEFGPSFPMPAFASPFLGATTIRPGRYNALGTAVGLVQGDRVGSASAVPLRNRFRRQSGVRLPVRPGDLPARRPDRPACRRCPSYLPRPRG